MKSFYDLLSEDLHYTYCVRNAFLKLTCNCCSVGRLQGPGLGLFYSKTVFFECGIASVLCDTARCLTGG